MLDFITDNYIMLLAILIVIFCIIAYLSANGKIFKKKETVEEKKDATNNESNNASTTINTNSIVDSTVATAATIANTTVNNNNDINTPSDSQTATMESAPLPEDIFTPIEEVPALNESVVAEPNETLVEPTEVDNTPIMENIAVEGTSVNEQPVAVEEVNETVVPLEQSQEPISYESNKDVLINVLDTPIGETVAETPAVEEITFDFMPVEENNIVEETVAPISETIDAPIIDEQPTVLSQEETSVEESVNQQEELIDDDPTLFVDESAFFNAHLYDEEPGVEDENPETPVEKETIDTAFNEIETLTDDIIDIPDNLGDQTLEKPVEEEPSDATPATEEIADTTNEETSVVENTDDEETSVTETTATVKDSVETLSTETSQEVDTAENASETNEDEEWKF